MSNGRLIISSKILNYSISKRSIYSGIDLGIESDPAPSTVSDPSTISRMAGVKRIFRREIKRSRSGTW